MIPPLFTWAAASGTVTALLGTTPAVRFFPFDEAPQPGNDLYGLPYAVWQLIYGNPANTVGHLPDADNTGIQIDAYGRTVSEARAVLLALRDAFEPHGYVVAFNGEEKEPETGLYRCGMTAEFWTDRP